MFKKNFDIDTYPIVEEDGTVRYVDKETYFKYHQTDYEKCKYDPEKMNKKESTIDGEYGSIEEFRQAIEKEVQEELHKEETNHETFENENQTEKHDDFTKSVWEEINRIFEYNDESKNYESPFIPGTKILKPRDRYDIETEGIYDTYEDYLSEYWSREIFTTDTFDQDSPYIEGTNILKPRQRRAYETSEEYEKFLKYYYDSHFNLEKFYSSPDKEQRSKHQVVDHRDDIFHKIRKRFLIYLTFIMVTLATIFGLKGNKSKHADSNQNIHKTVESVVDDVEQFSEDVQKDIAREVERIMNSKNNTGDIQKTKASTSTVGDVVKLRENTTYYYDAQMSKPTGSIGNLYSPKSSEYIVDGIALVSKKNNKIIATSYEGGLSAKEMMQMYGLEKDDCRVMYHISMNHDKLQLKNNKASQRGWIKFEKDNYNLKKNITKQSKSYVKRMMR